MKNRQILALVMVLLLLLSGCGGSAGGADMYSSKSEAAQDAPGEMENGMIASDSASAAGNVAMEDRKLVKTVRLETETEELDELLAGVDAKIIELQGYVESREIYNGSSYAQRRYRRADLVIRIPAEQVDGFVAHMDGISNVVSSNEEIEDVTLRYVDTESRMKALETEQERLLELLAQAQTMADLLEIEARLTDVRYELESVTSQLRTMDNRVNYATVYLNISEVQEYTPVKEKTVWERIAGGFMDSLEGISDGAVELFVWILANSPWLLLWGVLLLLLWKLKGKLPKRERKPRKASPKVSYTQEPEVPKDE